MNLQDNEFLLFPNDINHKSSSIITKTSNKIFKKKLSSSMLRHIFITNTLSPEIEELQKIAKKMSHSTSMQSGYVLHDK
jgi:hypothetical protein